MTLEQLVGREAVENIRGRPFGIAPNVAYDRDEFLRRAGDLFDVEKYAKAIQENPKNVSALDDLARLSAGYMPGDAQTNINDVRTDPSYALDQARTLLDEGYDKLARHVERNRASFLEKLSTEQLYSIFQRIPLYKTGNAEYDRIADLRNKYIALAKATQEGQDPTSIVAQEVNELLENAPEEQRPFIMKNREKMVKSLTNAVLQAIPQAYSRVFRDNEGNLRRDELIRYLEDNYRVAERFIDAVPAEERADYWNDNLKPQYVELARELYGSEKKAKKLEDNPEKEARKVAAGALGLVS